MHRRRVGLHAHPGDPRAIDAGLPGRGQREVDDAVADEGAAVGDAHDDGLVVGEVCDADDGAHGQGAVRGGHGVLVVYAAVGRLAVGVGRAVPACQADLAGDRFAVRQGRLRSGGCRRCGGAGRGLAGCVRMGWTRGGRTASG